MRARPRAIPAGVRIMCAAVDESCDKISGTAYLQIGNEKKIIKNASFHWKILC